MQTNFLLSGYRLDFVQLQKQCAANRGTKDQQHLCRFSDPFSKCTSLVLPTLPIQLLDHLLAEIACGQRSLDGRGGHVFILFPTPSAFGSTNHKQSPPLALSRNPVVTCTQRFHGQLAFDRHKCHNYWLTGILAQNSFTPRSGRLISDQHI